VHCCVSREHIYGGYGIVKEGQIGAQHPPEIAKVKVFLYRPGIMNGAIPAN